MRKSIKSKSKRKWIIGGFAFFGGIALLTTGFAAWVFGVNQNTSGSGVDVGSDTAINDTVFLDIRTGEDNKVVLAEKEEHPSKGAGEIASTKVDETGVITFDPAGMQIDLTYTVVWGKDQAVPKGINFKFPTTTDQEGLPQGVTLGDFANDSIKTIESNIKYQPSTRKDQTYFEAPSRIDLAEKAQAEMLSKPNVDSYTITDNIKVEVTWGSFFNNVSPVNYYNLLSKALYEKIGKEYTAQQYFNESTLLAQQATQELNIMHDLFDGKKIYLLATLEK